MNTFSEPIDGETHELPLLILLATLIGKYVRETYSTPSFFEFGTFTGKTSTAIAEALAEVTYEWRVVTIDLPFGLITANLDPNEIKYVNTPQKYVGTPIRDANQVNRRSSITYLRADSTKFDFTKYHGQMDMIFIDGGHSYETCLNDSQNAFNMLAPDGLIVWHDYQKDWPGVIKAIDELKQIHPEIFHLYGTPLCFYRK